MISGSVALPKNEPGVAPMDNTNLGELGGIFAGVLALLAALGGAVKYLLFRADKVLE